MRGTTSHAPRAVPSRRPAAAGPPVARGRSGTGGLWVTGRRGRRHRRRCGTGPGRCSRPRRRWCDVELGLCFCDLRELPVLCCLNAWPLQLFLSVVVCMLQLQLSIRGCSCPSTSVLPTCVIGVFGRTPPSLAML
jgi:hypothetical protein